MVPRVGEWILEDELARGGQGVVYRVRHALSGAPAAVKLLLEVDLEARLRLRREAKTLAGLRHPHLVAVFELGELPDGSTFMAMELVEGESLHRRVRREGPLPPAEAARVLGAVADALELCHQRGLVHRDVKPHNVLLERGTGRPLLIDFGLVKSEQLQLAWSTQDQAALTLEGQLLGTPAYMAPEQVDASLGPVGPLSDVYALGATLSFALTGQAPFRGASALELISQAIREAPPDPRQLNPGADPALAALCLACLAKPPEKRPRSAAAFAQALRAQEHAPARRRPVSWRVGLVVALGLGSVLAFAAAALREPPRSQAERLRQAGEARFKQGDVAGARAELDRAIALDPTYARAWYGRALVAHMQGDWQRARADYDRALELDPDLLLAHLNRGYLSLTQRDLPQARADLDRVLAIDPSLEQGLAWAHRGQVRLLERDLPGAIHDHERYLELGAETDPVRVGLVRMELARLYTVRGGQSLRAGERGEALADAERAIALGSQRADTWVLRATCRRMLGDLPGAAADGQRALELDLGYAPAHLERGLLRERLQDFPGAIADVERFLELAPDDPQAERARALLDSLRARAGR